MLIFPDKPVSFRTTASALLLLLLWWDAATAGGPTECLRLEGVSVPHDDDDDVCLVKAAGLGVPTASTAGLVVPGWESSSACILVDPFCNGCAMLNWSKTLPVTLGNVRECHVASAEPASAQLVLWSLLALFAVIGRYLFVHLQAHEARQGHSYCSQQGCERIKITAHMYPGDSQSCDPNPFLERPATAQRPVSQQAAGPCRTCGAPQVPAAWGRAPSGRSIHFHSV